MEHSTGHWANDAVFYHIYPLGLCGAPPRNDFDSLIVPRLAQLVDWIDHLKGLHVNALYLGPVFESTAHGYDTADYFRVDRRLGHNETLSQVVSALHREGIRVILDGVFNHVGRDFWAFRDVQAHQQRSAYRDWFAGLCFGGRTPHGDPFTYESWNGHYDLVKLNLCHPEVRGHLFEAIQMWIREFDIDGLRLDVADCLDIAFQRELAAFCRGLRPDFWLMGEVVHGDYRRWANGETLDSVTNYECYKGLYSSHVDGNYYEIAYALNRQFGENGLYRGLPLYNFADNHDVDRVTSRLRNPAHLYPLYCLLFTMPGVPSIYYGSEWGIEGRRNGDDDRPLRPRLDLGELRRTSPQPNLVAAIRRLAAIRHRSPALRVGSYRQLSISHEQLAFARQVEDEQVVVLVNGSAEAARFELAIPAADGNALVDLLNPGESFQVAGGRAEIDGVPPHWARILAVS
jgi:cyclomaltodextrinase